MAYDGMAAQRSRSDVARCGKAAAKKMSDGLAFMIGGNLCCGVQGVELMVRAGPAQYDTASQGDHPAM